MNSRILTKVKAAAAAAGLFLIAGACGEVAGVDDGMGAVQVTLQEATAEALFHTMTSEIAASPEGAAGRVLRENVKLLQVTVDGIQILPYCEEAGGQNGDGQCEDRWETLDLGDETFELDLLSLPSEDEDAIALAEGTVPVGEYHKIRLFVTDAIVAFDTEVSVGQATFPAYDANRDVEGTEFVEEDPTTWKVHPLEIPSADNTGIKADINLEVTEETEGEVGLLFDAEATFRNVIATGNGRVKMPPVLKVRQMNQEQNQIQDENQNGG